MIRIVSDADAEFLARYDRHVSPERLQQRLRDGQVYLYLHEASPVGWLQYSYFWGVIPFMEMLFLLEDYRRQGLGRRLAQQWESNMFQTGAELVLTSTQADEEAQHFYRRLGYKDCGALFLPTQPPAEIFLSKLKPDTEQTVSDYE